jgi:hypothetical protein
MMTRAWQIALVMAALTPACGGSDDSAFGGNGTSGGVGGGTGVTSTDDAKRAYLGLDASVDRAIELGFAGFNAASSANIPPESATGAKGGTMTVMGQVDQGASSNKTMNLEVAMSAYSDDGAIAYSTNAGAAPKLAMALKKIPTGNFSGSLSGTFVMKGGLEGSVLLTLSFTGDLEPDPNGGKVRRKPGTTHVTGTATSGTSTYSVDVTR